MIVRPFKVSDFLDMRLQPAQEPLRQHVTIEMVRGLVGPNSFTGEADGRPVWSFGWMPVYAHRALVWALVSEGAGAHFRSIHRIARRSLDLLLATHKRVEMDVTLDFEEGHRWARLLGFELEAPVMRGYQIDGRDAALYAKVR